MKAHWMEGSASANIQFFRRATVSSKFKAPEKEENNLHLFVEFYFILSKKKSGLGAGAIG